MTRGILYVATGDEYIREAILSARQLDTVMDVPIAIVADHRIEDPVFDHVIVNDDPKYSYIDKPKGFLQSPFSKTLYIDTDVYIVSSVNELFDMLDDFDLAAAVDPNEASLRMRGFRYFDDVPESVPEFNTGVIAFEDSPEVSTFLNSWIENYSESHHTDQPSFRKALCDSPIQFTALSSIYNCYTNYPMQVTGKVKILHDVGDETFLRKGEDVNRRVQEVASRINRTNGIRILHTAREDAFYAKSELGNLTTRSLRMMNKAALLIVEDGLKRTGELILKKLIGD